MWKCSAGSAIFAAAALGASGAIWANSPGPDEPRAASATMAARHGNLLANAGGNHTAVMRALATPQGTRDAATPGVATDTISSSSLAEPQRPDTAMMLLASLGMLATVVYRAGKR